MRTSLLDHGYVELVESWGSDERIIEAARMSTQKGFEGWGPCACPQCYYTSSVECPPGTIWKQENTGTGSTNVLVQCPTCKGKGEVLGDEKLLKYLYTHRHMTPFEMAGMTVEVQAPIFVFREWHRHRTQSYNEMSARYTPLPDVNYLPTEERFFLSGGKNKQAQAYSNTELSKSDVETWRRELLALYAGAEALYKRGLQIGVPKELARLPVPVGRYSRMRASANLRNWLQFLTLRMDENAQWEIRQYANEVGRLVESAFPRTWDLFKSS